MGSCISVHRFHLQGNGEGVADVICGNTCEKGDTYTLDYSATVPSGSFQGDQYNFHLVGTIAAWSGLPRDDVLNFDIATSKFAMATPQGVLETPIGSHDGIVLNTAQPAMGSHAGAPDGSETPSIDEPWAFSNNTGMSQTTAPVNPSSAGLFSGLPIRTSSGCRLSHANTRT
jgi:hypothetical protein